jgi:hypothetical protein
MPLTNSDFLTDLVDQIEENNKPRTKLGRVFTAHHRGSGVELSQHASGQVVQLFENSRLGSRTAMCSRLPRATHCILKWQPSPQPPAPDGLPFVPTRAALLSSPAAARPQPASAVASRTAGTRTSPPAFPSTDSDKNAVCNLIGWGII